MTRWTAYTERARRLYSRKYEDVQNATQVLAFASCCLPANVETHASRKGIPFDYTPMKVEIRIEQRADNRSGRASSHHRDLDKPGRVCRNIPSIAEVV